MQAYTNFTLSTQTDQVPSVTRVLDNLRPDRPLQSGGENKNPGMWVLGAECDEAVMCGAPGQVELYIIL